MFGHLRLLLQSLSYCPHLKFVLKLNKKNLSLKTRRWKLTTSVRRHRVLAGARGSRAACRSHTLILLRTHINIKTHQTMHKKRKYKNESHKSMVHRLQYPFSFFCKAALEAHFTHNLQIICDSIVGLKVAAPSAVWVLCTAHVSD